MRHISNSVTALKNDGTELGNLAPARYLGEKLTTEGGAVDFDVVTELAFPNRETFQAWMAQLSEPGAGEQVAVDEERFLDRSRTKAYVIEEYLTSG